MTQPRSTRFRKDRQKIWFELEASILKAEAEGLSGLTPDELARLPMLYRSTLSALNIAREISLDVALLKYLESLSGRAFIMIYGTRKKFLRLTWEFFSYEFPQSVRNASPYLAIATLITGCGIALAMHLVAVDPSQYYAFVPVEMAGGRNPAATTESLRAALYDDGGGDADSLAVFSSFLATHNAKIGITCFSLGVAFAVPVIYLLFYNGLVFGAFVGLYASRGLTLEVLAWILPHGVTELLAVLLCGAAGLCLGKSAAFPGEISRWDNVKIQMRRVGPMVIGAVIMFFIAAVIEGFFRQMVQSIDLRWLVASGTAIFWLYYFGFVGRR